LELVADGSEAKEGPRPRRYLERRRLWGARHDGDGARRAWRTHRNLRAEILGPHAAKPEKALLKTQARRKGNTLRGADCSRGARSLLQRVPRHSCRGGDGPRLRRLADLRARRGGQGRVYRTRAT